MPSIKSRAASAYRTSPSVKEFVDGYVQDPIKFKQLNELFSAKYKKPIENSEDAATAVALTFSPVGKTKETIIDDKVALEAMRDANISRRKSVGGGSNQYSIPQDGSLFDTFGDAQPISSQSGNFKGINGLFSDKDGNPYNGEIFITKNFVPAGIYAALKAYGTDSDVLLGNKGFTAIVENGRVKALKDKLIGLIDERTIKNAQLALDKEPIKGQRPDYGSRKNAPVNTTKNTKFVFPDGVQKKF